MSEPKGSSSVAHIKGTCLPARFVVDRLGGVSATSKVIGISQSAISRWLVSCEQKGSGGQIPQRYWAEILAFAYHHKIDLTLSDLAGIPR